MLREDMFLRNFPKLFRKHRLVSDRVLAFSTYLVCFAIMTELTELYLIKLLFAK